MAIRNLRYDGDMILYKESKRVEVFDEHLKQMVEDMFETMYKYNGVGLAAPQIGILKRVLVIDTGEEGEKLEMINPTITKLEKEVILSEGCLSFPNVFGNVRRYNYTEAEYMTKDGEKKTIKAEGLLAQAIQHEIDHLNGVLFIDQVIDGKFYTFDDKGKKKNIVYKSKYGK
jgi:peptide deformylase